MATDRTFGNMLNQEKPYPTKQPKRGAPKKGVWDKLHAANQESEAEKMAKELKDINSGEPMTGMDAHQSDMKKMMAQKGGMKMPRMKGM